MSTFEKFSTAIHANYIQLQEHLGRAYSLDLDVDDLWDRYLSAFPEGTNPMFRERTEHDCSCCRSFIKNVGGLVFLDSQYNYVSIWSMLGTVEPLPYPYDVVAKAMDDYVIERAHTLGIDNVYLTTERGHGVESNTESTDTGVITWNHFHAVHPSHTVKSDAEIGMARAHLRARFDVGKRGLAELSMHTLDTVKQLIESDSLYRGAEHLQSVNGFLKLKLLQEAYYRDGNNDVDKFAWKHVENPIMGFRNTVIGTLAVDIEEGMEVDQAVARFESKVAPENYQRPKPVITEGMVTRAMNKLDEMGLREAISRRHARISDVHVDDVLFVDGDTAPLMKDALADLLMEEVKRRPVDYSQAPTIPIAQFLSEVLPTAGKLDLVMEGRHTANLMNLTAPVTPVGKQLFKWDNYFSWGYNGDLADSVITQRVRDKGGKTDGVLRVSLAWHNTDDLDLHCNAVDPAIGGVVNRIYHNERQGILDVDANYPTGDTNTPVENMVWQNLGNRDVALAFEVVQYNQRNSSNVGYILEVMIDGQMTHYHSPRSPSRNRPDQVLEIEVRAGAPRVTYVADHLSTEEFSTDMWGVTTGQPIPVTSVMMSPNYWQGQSIGNQHLFFMLEGCLNPEPVRCFYNEYLDSSLHEHRRVFEVLGAKTKAPYDDQQMAGVGFSSTKRDTVTVVVHKDGDSKPFNIQF